MKVGKQHTRGVEVYISTKLQGKVPSFDNDLLGDRGEIDGSFEF
jgi:hypothetical protein